MPSNRPRVWLITGACSPLGYRLSLAALARGDLVIASAVSQSEVDRLCSIGAHGIKMDCEMSFGQVKDKIHGAVSYYGRVDFLINNSDAVPHRASSAQDLPSAYDTNTFSYAAIQVTKAVSQVSIIRQIVVIVPDDPGDSQQGFASTYLDNPYFITFHESLIDSSTVTDNVEATAQLLASEYRSKNVRVLLVTATSTVSIVGSRYAPGDPRVAVERIVAQMTEGGSSESGIRVL